MKLKFPIVALAIGLAAISPASAQWTNKGGYPGTVHQRGWDKPVYDSAAKALILYWTNPDCCAGTFSNALFHYAVGTNTWSQIWTHNTQGNETTSNPSFIRSSGTVSATFGTAMYFQVGDVIWVTGATNTSFNGFFQVTAAPDTLHASWAQALADASTSGGITYGPGDSPNGPSDKHPYGIMGFDSTRNSFYTGFGAAELSCDNVAGCGPDTYNYSFMTYPLTGTTWTMVCGPFYTTCPSPNKTEESGSAYDVTTDKIFIYSGLVNGTPIDSMWTWAPATNTWATVCSSCAPGGIDGPGVFAAGPGRIIIYGGVNGSGTHLRQAWSLNTATGVFTSIGGTGPDWARFPIIDYVPRLNAAIMIGGESPAHVWKLDLSTHLWSDLGITGGPTLDSNVANNAGAYDPNADRFVLFLSATAWSLQLPATPPSVSIPLTIQESIVSGQTGVNRTNEPVTVGLPIPDSANLNNINQLGMSGATAWQFKQLATWPDGNLKWALVDTEASLTAGGTNTAYTLTTGSGNSAGSNLGTDNGTTITVATGTATFTIQKANHDYLHQVNIGGTNLLGSESPQGLILVGPPWSTTPANWVCSSLPCPSATVYASSNDSSSTCSLEENGPVKAAVKCTGALKDASGNLFMRYTSRMKFYLNKNYVWPSIQLQNADYDNTYAGTYVTANKGFQSLEIRLPMSLGTGTGYIFGTASSPISGSFSGTENAYIYQGYSTLLEPLEQFGDDCNWISPDYRSDPRSYIARTHNGGFSGCDQRQWTYAQEGYKIYDGATLLGSGTRAQYPGGWADLADSSGDGVAIGAYRAAGYWPKSLQFMNGGSEIRIGIYPDQTLGGTGGQQYIQSWPQYETSNVWLEFHTSALASPANDFELYEENLIARGPRAAYNNAGVFPYTLLASSTTDAFDSSVWTAQGKTAPTVIDLLPNIYRTKNWRFAGGGNQIEFKWANLLLWITRGMTGRYLQARHFYQFVGDQAFPRSDLLSGTPFHWRQGGFPGAAIGSDGLPDNVVSANGNIGCDTAIGATLCANSARNQGASGNGWIDPEHAHWYGLIDWYFMTGDMGAYDEIVSGATDGYGNPNSNWALNGFYFDPRQVGVAEYSAARLYNFYSGISDATDLTAVSTTGDEILVNQFYPNYKLQPDWGITGSYVSGSFSTGDNLTQAVTGATATVDATSVGTPTNVMLSTRSGSPDATHIWTNGTQQFTPTAVPTRIAPWTYGSASQGVNRKRGNFFGCCGTTRTAGFEMGIALGGIWEYAQQRGSSWVNAGLGSTPFQTILDLESGIANHVNSELTASPTGAFAYEIGVDAINILAFIGGNATVWFNAFVPSQYGDNTYDWQDHFKSNLYSMAPAGGGSGFDEYGTIQIDAVINALNNPGPHLVDVPVTVTPLGSGSYHLTFTLPTGATTVYRVKADANLPLVDWIGFNPVTFAWVGNPATTDPWFAGTEITAGLTTGTPGITQTITVTYGATTTANFAIRALTSNAGGVTPTIAPAVQMLAAVEKPAR